MTKSGTVLSVHSGTAKIRITRDSACGDNCAACGLCDMREMVVELPVDDDINVGDKVILVTKNSTFLKNSALGYITLTALLILGAIIGAGIGGDVLSFVMALAFVGIGVLTLRLIPQKNTEIKVEKSR